MNMQVEEFYNKAKDADYLIYNSTIDGGVKSVDELIEKCSVLSDFKAVKVVTSGVPKGCLPAVDVDWLFN